jgi:RecJ-like exonuclease
MRRKASKLATRIKKSKKVYIAAHIDADGIAAGGIASKSLERAGIEHEVGFYKNLDDDALESIKDINSELTWFVDFGSGDLNLLKDLDAVITDHHAPIGGEVPREKRMNILEFSNSMGNAITNHLSLNPHDFGKDGATDISGAGVTYLVAKALDKGNTDLSSLAVVGAIGDIQDARDRKLSGSNRKILEEGKKAGVVDAVTDLRYFGRASRPLIKFLQYGNDPPIPRLAENEKACTEFLTELGIRLLDGERLRSWSDLEAFEKRLIISELVRMLIKGGHGSKRTERLVGEVYVLNREEGMLSDAKEYSTLLNSCGRYEKAQVGLKVCMGDRDKELAKALKLLQGHRGNIVSSLKLIQDMGISELDYLQYFHGKDKVMDSVVGIMAGMILNSAGGNRSKPIIGFAYSPEGVKVSSRSTKELVARGLNLSDVMRNAAKSVGGVGGGHNIAAGATIPRGKEEEFIGIAHDMIRRQLG